MTSTGRLGSLTAAASCWAVLGALTGCSGLDSPSDGPSRAAAGETCLTDLSTPRATYEVEVAAAAPGTQADYLRPTSFLTADAAVVQVLDDDAELAPHVLGGNTALQAALDDARVWSVAGDGFLVETPAEVRGSPDPAAPEPSELSIVDGRGGTSLEGPRVERRFATRAVGNQFVVVDDTEDLTAYDIGTGAEVEPGPAVLGRGLARPSLASTTVLTDEGAEGGVIDARTGRTFGLDDLVEREVGDVSVSGSGDDRVLLSGEIDDRTSRFWTWSSAGGLREVYSTDDEDATGDRVSPGVCGDYLYVVEDDELRIQRRADGCLELRYRVVPSRFVRRMGLDSPSTPRPSRDIRIPASAPDGDLQRRLAGGRQRVTTNATD